MAQDDEAALLAATDSAVEAARPPGLAGYGGRRVRRVRRTPGFPPHRPRVTDQDPDRRSAAAHGLHALLPVDPRQRSGPSRPTCSSRSSRAHRRRSVRLNNMFIGLGIALALLGIGIRRGALGQVAHGRRGVHRDAPPRPAAPTRPARPRSRSSDVSNEESGFGRRTLIRNTPHRRARRASRCPRSCCSAASPRRTETPSSCSATRMWNEGHASRARPLRHPDQGLRRHPRHRPSTSSPRVSTSSSTSKLEEKAKAAVLLMRLEPEDLHEPPEPRGLVVRRHRRLLQDLHARRMPRRALRAADAPPALPLPPVAVRRGQPLRGHLRPGQAPAAAAADHRRRRGLPRRAERLHRTRRPELLGAPLSHRTDRRPVTDEPEALGGASSAARPNYIDERTSLSGFVKELGRKIFPDHWSFMLGEVALYSFVVDPALRHVPDVLLPGLDGPRCTTTAPTCRSRASRCRRRWRRRSTSRSTSAAACSCARCTTGRRCCSWPRIGLHMLRIFFTGAFRKPRELNWVIGFVLFILAMAEGFTGYSLPDDLLSGNGLRIIDGMVKGIPVIGTWTSFLLFGGEFPGNDDRRPPLHAAHPAAAGDPRRAARRAPAARGDQQAHAVRRPRPHQQQRGRRTRSCRSTRRRPAGSSSSSSASSC